MNTWTVESNINGIPATNLNSQEVEMVSEKVLKKLCKKFGFCTLQDTKDE